MRALALLLLGALAAAPAAAATAEEAQFVVEVASHELVDHEVPDIAVPHYMPQTFGYANAATQSSGPQPTWNSHGVGFRLREGTHYLIVPILLNADQTRVDEQYIYPLHLGDVSADLGDNVDTLDERVLPLLPGKPSTGFADSGGVPDLAVAVSLRQGDLDACVGDCRSAPLAASLSGLAGPGSFGRGFGIAQGPGAAFAEARHVPDALLSAQPGAAPSPAPPEPAVPVGAQSVAPSILPALSGPAIVAAAIAAGLLLLGIPAALYSKIRRDSTLDNETRRLIYESVCATPGLSIQDVARRASVSHSTAAYHLERLSSAGLVVSTGDGNKVRYYRNGGRFTEPERKLLPILENAETVRVLESVLGSPWTYRAEIAARLGVTATTVNWHLKRLFGCAVLTERREGRNAYLFVERAHLLLCLRGLQEKLTPSASRDVAARLLALLAGTPAPPGMAPAPQPEASPAPPATMPSVLAPARYVAPQGGLGFQADPR